MRRKLAEGGMAEIFLCSALGPEGFAKDVVIKRVRPFLADDPSFVDMFVAEARLASRLEHPNIVQIFDFDRHEDTYYLAMEYVRGASLWQLRRRCREEGRAFPPVLAAQIGMEVARALAYAHRLTVKGEALNVVHRDVTPHNVLVSYEGAVKLGDFGIAHAGKASTAPGMLKGKFAYMSPEQSRGEPVDGRCDVFALGVVLWELLTGGRPFEAESDFAVLRAVQQRVITPPGRLNPAVPPELDQVVMRALERDLALRWQSAAEFERALQRVVMAHQRQVEDTDVGAYLSDLIEPMESSVALAPVPAPGPSAAPARETPSRAAAVTPSPSLEPTPILPRTPAGAPDPGAAPLAGAPRSSTADLPAPARPLTPADGAASVSLRVAWAGASSTAAGLPDPALAGVSPEAQLTPSPNPDEDGHAPTWLVARDGGGDPLGGAATRQGMVTRVEEARPRVRFRGLALGLSVAAGLGAVAIVIPRAAAPTPVATVPVSTGTAKDLQVAAPLRGAPSSTPSVPTGPDHRPQVDGARSDPQGTRSADGNPGQEASGSEPVTASPPTMARGVSGGPAPGSGPESSPTMTAPSLAAASRGLTPAGGQEAPVDDVVRASTQRSARKRRLGLVQLEVFPNAQLRVDGRARGEVSGQRALQLPEGRHTVVLVHPHRSETFEVEVKSGAAQQVRFNAFGSTR